MEPNVPLLRKVWEHVKDEPQDFNQRTWVDSTGECGTSYCFAGHTLVMAGRTLTHDLFSMYLDGVAVSHVEVREAAARELGLEQEVADELFWGRNDLAEIRDQVSMIIGEELIL